MPETAHIMGSTGAARTDEWGTPQWLFDLVNREYGPFELDVCATPENAKVTPFFTPAEDGLLQHWGARRCWMNPPYGRQLPRWIEKAAMSAQLRGAFVVGLIPARVDTNAFHDHVLGAGAAIHPIRGRIQFEGQPLDSRGRKIITPPFGSLLVVWDGHGGLYSRFKRSIDARAQKWGGRG